MGHVEPAKEIAYRIDEMIASLHPIDRRELVLFLHNSDWLFDLFCDAIINGDFDDFLEIRDYEQSKDGLSDDEDDDEDD